MLKVQLTFREDVRPSDVAAVRRLVESTGFFSSEEIGIAVELVEERLLKGTHSGYYFLFAEEAGAIRGYSCFGPIPCSSISYDLYWIVVDTACRGAGIGKEIMRRSEETIRRLGGTRVYVDTSSRAQYAPTRAYYTACGYVADAELEHFYHRGDNKVIYVKVLGPP